MRKNISNYMSKKNFLIQLSQETMVNEMRKTIKTINQNDDFADMYEKFCDLFEKENSEKIILKTEEKGIEKNIKISDIHGPEDLFIYFGIYTLQQELGFSILCYNHSGVPDLEIILTKVKGKMAKIMYDSKIISEDEFKDNLKNSNQSVYNNYDKTIGIEVKTHGEQFNHQTKSGSYKIKIVWTLYMSPKSEKIYIKKNQNSTKHYLPVICHEIDGDLSKLKKLDGHHILDDDCEVMKNILIIVEKMIDNGRITEKHIVQDLINEAYHLFHRSAYTVGENSKENTILHKKIAYFLKYKQNLNFNDYEELNKVNLYDKSFNNTANYYQVIREADNNFIFCNDVERINKYFDNESQVKKDFCKMIGDEFPDVGIKIGVRKGMPNAELCVEPNTNKTRFARALMKNFLNNKKFPFNKEKNNNQNNQNNQKTGKIKEGIMNDLFEGMEKIPSQKNTKHKKRFTTTEKSFDNPNEEKIFKATDFFPTPSYEEAKEIISNLNIKTVKEYREYCANNKNVHNLHSNPEYYYRGQSFSWNDYLGI